MGDVKVMFLGDVNVGKTCMLVSYSQNTFPEEYVPTVFDNYTTEIEYKDETYTLGLWDTAGGDEYDTVRPLSFPGTQVFVICFSVVSLESYDHVNDWAEEIRSHMPSVPPMILVGTKCDLRDHENYLSPEYGEKKRAEIEAKRYVECSAKTGEQLSDVFVSVVEVCAVKPKGPSFEAFTPRAKKKKGGCMLF